jgi:hypothetical protein
VRPGDARRRRPVVPAAWCGHGEGERGDSETCAIDIMGDLFVQSRGDDSDAAYAASCKEFVLVQKRQIVPVAVCAPSRSSSES